MLVSKCCGAGPVDDDIMICPDCKEHLGDEDIEDDELEEEETDMLEKCYSQYVKEGDKNDN